VDRHPKPRAPRHQTGAGCPHGLMMRALCAALRACGASSNSSLGTRVAKHTIGGAFHRAPMRKLPFTSPDPRTLRVRTDGESRAWGAGSLPLRARSPHPVIPPRCCAPRHEQQGVCAAAVQGCAAAPGPHRNPLPTVPCPPRVHPRHGGPIAPPAGERERTSTTWAPSSTRCPGRRSDPCSAGSMSSVCASRTGRAPCRARTLA